MKMIALVPCSRKAAASLVALIAFTLAATTRAQGVYLTFTGGHGSEVKISWSSPIVYTLTGSTGIGAVNPTFVFQSVTTSSAIFSTQGAVGGVAPTYTSTGAGSSDGTQTINTFFASNFNFNTVHPDDVVFYATTDTANTLLTAGDVFTLSAGSLRYDGSPTTSAGYMGALPADGYYNTFIADGNNTYYQNLGSGASAIPEPSTYAMMAGAAILGFAVWRRRARA
ncbi:PEP-CTERM sorting domain-containing protein [Horticoccus luteus]|uniref:PEP-CTERM sorting domain-containing protein n=2 Tax=Horticoccus luteus TaxID=2862869 RepID=A0A8F9TV55_9BACT|nr:PEP-CTERM sorting domain-containing protein [Horticoccus luteus]